MKDLRFMNPWINSLLLKLGLPYQKVLLVGANATEVRDSLQPSELKKYEALSPTDFTQAVNGSPATLLNGPETPPWDLIVLLGTLDETHDVMSLLHAITPFCSRSTRVAVISFSKGRRDYTKRQYKQANNEYNWLPRTEVANVLELAGFEVVKQSPEVLLPYDLGPFSRATNRWLAPLPIFRHFVVAIVTIARLQKTASNDTPRSLSIIIPTRNEAGNIHRILREIPKMTDNQELIFVEGNSTDNTWETLKDQLGALPDDYPYSTQLHKQTGKGKGDAVRMGFDKANGEILMILDADLTVPPGELPLFYDALISGKTEFANGSRLVYPQEKEAMRFLNYIANKLFGLWFTFVMGQQVRDTLCGTKVLWREDYQRIASNRSYFGEIDPFGDFDLLFGAARLNLKIRDIPVHYKERTYGSTNISRFRHGWLLVQMSALAARKLVFAPAPKAPKAE